MTKIIEVNDNQETVTLYIGAATAGNGTVTSVGLLSSDSALNISNSPITSDGNITTTVNAANMRTAIDFDNQVTNNTAVLANTAKVGVTNQEQNTINSELEDGMTGEDLVLNVLSLTQAEYDAGTPVSTTFYIITDA